MARTAFDDPKQDLYKHKGDDEWLAKQWAGYNKKFFGGKLKKPKEIYWIRGGKALGRCGSDFDGKKIFVNHIEISKEIENYTTFRNTLVHEMVHQWVDETYATKDIIQTANACGKARSHKWWNSIKKSRGAGPDGHHGTWLAKCEELMKKDKTLKLTKYGTSNETQLTNRQVNKALKSLGKLHCIVQEGDPRTPRRHFYFCTDKAYKELLKDIKDGMRDGEWAEYEFDEKKMIQEIKSPMTYVGSRYYKGNYFDNLCERGLIDKYSKKVLGGVKIKHTRRTRSRLWW